MNPKTHRDILAEDYDGENINDYDLLIKWSINYIDNFHELRCNE